MATRNVEAEPALARTGSAPKAGMLRRAYTAAYRWAVDTSSSVTFNTPVGMTDEVLLGNLSFNQSLHVREASALISMVTARPYGVFRDFVFRRLKTDEDSSLIRKAFTNATASVLFGTPIYAATLLANGTDRRQLVTSLAVGILSSPITSMVSGTYYDKVRKLFGLRPACDIRREGAERIGRKGQSATEV